MSTIRSSRPAAWYTAHATVFLSSFCVMVVELVAGRMISRYLGASIYTWTSVIGIILGGLALGNWAGGWIADRFRARPALSLLFLASSATCVAIHIVNTWIGSSTLLWDLSWPLRVATHVGLVFFLPAAILGTIGPVVGKLALSLGESTGRTLGSVYAWGVVGSIVGTFLTGYWLVSVMGTGAIIWSVSGLLAILGIVYAPRRPEGWAWSAAVVVGAVLALSPATWAATWGQRMALRQPAAPGVLYVDESRYSHIEIRRISEQPEVRGMYLDKLLHSQLAVENPDELLYGYVQIFSALTRHRRDYDEPMRTVTIGGGGYVFPRYLERHWPNADVEVVEIDPAVTEAAYAAFGLPRSTAIQIHHMDGRVFINRAEHDAVVGADPRPFDVIYLDALNDFSVPSQLTTREFFEKTNTLLTDDGLLLVNFIDVVDSGRLAGALMQTVGQVFDHVELFTSDGIHPGNGPWRATFVLAASREPIEFVADESVPYATTVHRLSLELASTYVTAANKIVLQDRFAPVENLLTAVVQASSRELAAGDSLRRALSAEKQGDDAGYARFSREALRLDPHFPEAHYNLGIALFREGRAIDAEHHLLRAVGLKPDYAEAQFNLGALYYSSGDVDRAWERFRRAVAAQPRMVQAQRALAVVAEARGDLQTAREAYREALRLEPDSEAIAGQLARLEATPTSGTATR